MDYTYTPEEKISRAKVQILKKYPFYAYIVMHMGEHQRTDIPSMGVDYNGNLYYNPQFVEKIDHLELQGVLVHEALHIVLRHLNRLGTKDKEWWNIATDLIINRTIQQEGLSLPKEGLIPDAYNDSWTHPHNPKIVVEKISEKNAEAIYDGLMKHASKKQKNPEGFDQHGYGDKATQETIDGLNKTWTKRIVEAATIAKQQGKLPAGIDTYLKKLLTPEFSWKQLLYRYITNQIPHDTTYSRPSRKSQATNVYLPSTKKENLQVVVGVDVSGSISQEEYDEFISETVGIAKSFQQVKMDILTWDTSVTSELPVHNGNIEKILNHKMTGGGGTEINCLLKKVNKDYPDTKILVVLTDGYFGRITTPTPYDIIWVLNPHSTDSAIKEHSDEQIILKMKRKNR